MNQKTEKVNSFSRPPIRRYPRFSGLSRDIESIYRAKRVELTVRSCAGTRRAFRFSQPLIIQRRSWAFEPMHHKEWLQKRGVEQDRLRWRRFGEFI